MAGRSGFGNPLELETRKILEDQIPRWVRGNRRSCRENAVVSGLRTLPEELRHQSDRVDSICRLSWEEKGGDRRSERGLAQRIAHILRLDIIFIVRQNRV